MIGGCGLGNIYIWEIFTFALTALTARTALGGRGDIQLFLYL